MTKARGFEEIPLDLSAVPSVEAGLADAAEHYTALTRLAAGVLPTERGGALFPEHLTFVSFLNRASSLHRGVTSAVRDANPHAAFTLLRAYLEAVVTVLYVDANPDYVQALERPMRDLPPRTRKRWDELFEFAAVELAGVRTVYALLNEMAHFGATAMWHPFRLVGETEHEAHIDMYTGPRWRDPNDAKTALAMLRECDEAMLVALPRYASHHIAPKVAAIRNRDRIRDAMASLASAPPEGPNDLGAFPSDVAAAAIADRLFAWCEEHQAWELADGVDADRVETWAAGRARAGAG